MTISQDGTPSAGVAFRRLSRMTKSREIVAATICMLLLAAAWYVLQPSDDGHGPYSGKTKSQLRAASGGVAPFVPASLPKDLDESASESDFVGSYEVGKESFGGDEVAFSLGLVSAAHGRPAHRSEIVIEYQSAVLDKSGRIRYEVHQLPEGLRITNPCGPSAAPPIRRSSGTTRLIVCSSHPEWGTDARSYWTSVLFTNDLESVDWLRGDAA